MQPIKQLNLINRCLGISFAGLAVLVLGFIFAPTLISEASATNARTFINWSPVFLTLDPDYGNGTPGSAGHGDINLNFVAPTSVTGNNKGTMRVTKKTIAVSTSGQYYAVYLQTGSSNNQLSHSSASTTLAINSVSGTWTNPVAFTGRGWGYAVPGSPITNGFVAGDTTLATYTSLPLDTDMTYASDSHYNTGKWAAVPTNATVAQQIWKATTTNPLGFGEYESGGDTITGDTANNKFDIYYAAMADNDLIAGEYKNTIVYTAIASSGNLDNVSNNIGRSKAYVTGGDVETLTFDLAMSIPSLTASDVKVYLVPHATTNANGYTTSGLTTTYQCSNITNFSISNGQAKLDCTIPTNPTGATEGGATRAGEWDFWINLPTYNYNYVSRYVDEDNIEVGTITYAGLQTKKRNSTDPVITEMQEMTSSICKNTNMWGTGVVDSARVYNYTGTGTALASSASASAAIGLGTFLLGDTRETVTSGGQAGTNYKTYLVRRLADGNCWMVQNLDLNLADFTSGKSKRLTSENTNLNTKDIWIPDANFSAYRSVLEPGPSGGLSGLSVATYQFQSRNNFGPNLFWGSRYQAGTTTDNTGTADNNGLVIVNNANSSFARSYNNDLAYLTGTQNIKNPTACAANTTEGSAWITECQQNGQIGNAGGSLTSVTSNDGTTQDSTWQPGTITSNTDTTFTMRGSNYLGDNYNWYAATAESGTWNTTSGNMQDDICPKGWRLPTNSGEGSWDNLIKTTYQLTSSYGYTAHNRQQLNKIMQLPLSIPFAAGYYASSSGTLVNRGSSGNYWSSTPYSTDGALRLSVNCGGILHAQLEYGKAYGFSVRCVARD